MGLPINNLLKNNMVLLNTSMYPVTATLNSDTGEWIQNKPIQFLVKTTLALNASDLNEAMNKLSVIPQDDTEFGNKVIFASDSYFFTSSDIENPSMEGSIADVLSFVIKEKQSHDIVPKVPDQFEIAEKTKDILNEFFYDNFIYNSYKFLVVYELKIIKQDTYNFLNSFPLFQVDNPDSNSELEFTFGIIFKLF